MFCGDFTLTLRNVQGIFYASISTYIHPISCQKSSLCYVALQHLTLQKHWNQ